MRRLGGGHQVAGEQIILRQHGPNEQRPDQRPTVAGDQAHPHMWIADTRRVGGEDEIAHQRDRGAQTDPIAVHSADDQLRAFQQAVDDLAAFAGALGELARIGRRLSHVAAGAERLAGAGQDHHPGLAIMPQVEQAAAELMMQRLTEGVVVVRPVQGDGQRSCVAFQRQRFVVRPHPLYPISYKLAYL